MVETISLLPLSAAILSLTLALTAGIAPKRSPYTVAFFLALNVTTFLWAFAYFVQLNWGHYADPSLAPFGTADTLLLLATAVGVAGSPTYWFLFAAATTHRAFWTTSGGILLAHVPLAYTIAVSVTNPWHHLFIAELPGGRLVDGPLAIPHFIATFVLVGAGIWMLLTRALSLHTAAGRRQAATLGIVSCVPLAGGLLWATKPLTGIDIPVNPTPVLFPLVNAVLAYEVFYRGLGDIVPMSTMSAIMDNTDVGLAYLDPEFDIVSVNSVFVRQSGHTPLELLGRNYFDVFPLEGERQGFVEARDTGDTVGREADQDFMTARNGRRSFWNWSLSPVSNQAGELEGLVLSLADVSQSVLERELNRRLSDLDSRLSAGFTSDEVLRECVAVAAAALGYETSAILIRRDDRLLLMQHCERPETTWEEFEAEAFPHLALVLKSGEPLEAEDALAEDRLNPYIMRALGLRSVLALPLTAGGGVIGVLSFGMVLSPVKISDVHMDFALRFASAVTLSLENARVYEAERRIAETLQESMLRLPETVRGLEFAHTYRSAGQASRVGGDFYDLFGIDDERVALLIGDVAGHGLEAAVMTSLIKDSVLVETLHGSTPAGVLSRANEILYKKTAPEVFATAFFAELHLAPGRMVYCRAGHPPPMLVRTDGRVERLSGGSPIIGALPAAGFEDESVDLRAGDILVMYTDGLTEARRDGVMFGEDRLAERLAGLSQRSPSDVVDAVFAAVLDFARGALSDDLALLVVRLPQVPLAPVTSAPAGVTAGASTHG